MNKIIFSSDSRDKIFQHRFGGTVEFPKEINFDTNFPDEVQPTGDVKCVAYTTCDLAEDQQNIEFDVSSVVDLWQRVPSNTFGSDPRDVLGEAVKNGLRPKGQILRINKWKSYWRADLGPLDPFDNVRSTMMIIKCPIGVGTYWYQEWHSSDILPIGKNPQNGHMYDIQGWKEINGEPHFIIEAWLGRKVYMSREVFNEALKPYGMQTWVLSTAELDMRRTGTLTEWITDLMTNLIIVLRDLIKIEQAKQPPTPPVIVPPEPPQPEPSPIVSPPIAPKPTVGQFAEAIQVYEGWFPPSARHPGGSNSWRNKNPGNIKHSNGKFLVFTTEANGFQYLCDYIKRVRRNEHPAYPKDCNLYQFFNVYAPVGDSNFPKTYAVWVSHRIGVLPDYKIADLQGVL